MEIIIKYRTILKSKFYLYNKLNRDNGDIWDDLAVKNAKAAKIIIGYEYEKLTDTHESINVILEINFLKITRA